MDISASDKKFYRLASSDTRAEIVLVGYKNKVMRSNGGWATCMTPGYETEADLREKELIPDDPCRECGQIFSARTCDDIKQRMLERHVCFTCDFWLEKINHRNSTRINGQHYVIGSVKYPHRGDGYGGWHFRIKKQDGEVVDTCDLWSQGPIPPHFRDRLPDNAEFLPTE